MSDVNVSVTEEGTVAVMVGGEAGIAAHDADPDAHAGKDTSFVRYSPGQWYPAGPVGGASKTLSNETVYATPIEVHETITVVSLAIRIATAGEAGSVIRLGIAADDGNGIPASILLDAGTIAADTTGAKAITVSQELTPGLYWRLTAAQLAPTTAPAVFRTDDTIPLLGSNSTFSSGANSTKAYLDNGIAGAFPAAFTLDAYDNQHAPNLMIGV